MTFGNYPITEQFFGNTPIKEVWLGNYKVWTYTYDYEISNVHLEYSDGADRLWCDGTNYAIVVCTLTKKKGTTISSTTTQRMTFTASLNQYLSVDDTGRISFNLKDYGTEDMSYHSNPLTILITPSLYEIPSTYNLYLQLEPNKLLSHTSAGWDITGSTSLPFLNYYNTSAFLTFSCHEVFYNTYLSEQTKYVKESRTGYIIDEKNHTLIGSGNTFYNVPVTRNNNSYPVLHQWRISQEGEPEQYLRDDFYYDIMQKSNVTRTTPLALYWGSYQVLEDFVIAECVDFILLNDAHKDGLHYEFECNDSSISIIEDRGIIYINGVTSSTMASIEVTVWEDVAQPEQEWWEEPIEYEPIYYSVYFEVEGY